MNDQHFQQLILRRLGELEAAVLQRVSAIEYNVAQLVLGAQAMALDLSALQAEVTKQTSVTQSAIALLKGLHDQIAAIPPSTDPATQAALDSIKAGLASNDQALADAIVANTPAASSSTATPST